MVSKNNNMEFQSYPLIFLREIEKKHKINIDAEYNSFVLENPFVAKMNVNTQIQDTITCCAIEFSIPVSDVIGKTRKREVVLLRQLLMTYFYIKFPMSLQAIGNQFGGRDHSTVSHAKDTISDLYLSNDGLLKFYLSTVEKYIDINLLKNAIKKENM